MTSQLSLYLPAGNSLTITANAAAGGAAYINNTLNDGQFAIAASAVVVLGPFNVSYNFTLLGLPVLPSYVITRASDGYDFNNLAVLSASGPIVQWEGVNKITKAGVAALTLVAPGADQEGQMFYVTSQNANAHTITATSLLNNGGSGAPYTTATFAAHAGASICLCAINGAWNVLSVNNVTLS